VRATGELIGDEFEKVQTIHQQAPEKCDEQLSKLMLQLEELEGRFGEFDQFIEQLATKREDVLRGLQFQEAEPGRRAPAPDDAGGRAHPRGDRSAPPPARPRSILTPLAEPEGPSGYPRPEVAR